MLKIDFFKDAKFGDRFIDTEGKTYYYHYNEPKKTGDGKVWTYHYLIREPAKYTYGVSKKEVLWAPYESFVFKGGYGVPTNLRHYPIEQILENLDKNYLITHKLEVPSFKVGNWYQCIRDFLVRWKVGLKDVSNK